VDPVEIFSHGPSLIGLQLTDEVPGQASVAQGVDFGEALLQIIFAEVALTEVGECGHGFYGLLLADCDERDLTD
jgi:hypothetical protein